MQAQPFCLIALLGQAAAGVLEFHNGPRRDGFYVDPTFTPANVAATTLDTCFAANVVVPGPVYAQPLFLTLDKGGGLIILATEQAVVLAVDAATGEEAWRAQLGTPVPLDMLQSGNIDPYAVTGTPAIDAMTGMLYVDSLLLVNGTITHSIFTIFAPTGEVLPYTVDVSRELGKQGISSDPAIQNQRGGLTLMDGTLYVPYGGYNGDCGNYHGFVVGMDLADHSVKAWHTALKGGAWSPGGISNDGHFLYIGEHHIIPMNANDSNLNGCYLAFAESPLQRVWGGGEAVIRLQPGPAFSGSTRDYFAPANWAALDAADTDIGSSGPVLVDVPGASPSALVVEMGKDGAVYLLDRDNLGSLGQGVYSATVGSKVIINAPSVYNSTTGQYLALVTFGEVVQCPPGQAGNLTGLLLAAATPPSFSVAWCAVSGGHGTPISVSPDGSNDASVWQIAAETSNALMAFNGDTGELLYKSADLSAVARYQAPIVVAGTVYVVSNTSLYAFRVGTTGPGPAPSLGFALLPIDLAELPADLPNPDDQLEPPGLAISPSP